MDSCYGAVAKPMSSTMQKQDFESTAVLCALKTCESGSESQSSQSSEPTDEGYEEEEDEEEEEEEDDEDDHVPRHKHLCAAYTVSSRKEGGTPKQCRNLALNKKNYCWITKHQTQWRDLGVPLLRETRRVRRTSSPTQRNDLKNEVVPSQLADMQQRLSDMEASWNHTFESLNRTVSRQCEEQDKLRQQMAQLLIARDGHQNHYRPDSVGSTPLETNDEYVKDDLDEFIDDYYLRGSAPVTHCGQQADSDLNSSLDISSALSNEPPLTPSKPNKRAEDNDERSLANVQGGIQDLKMPQSSHKNYVTKESYMLSSSWESSLSASSSSSTQNEPTPSYANDESESTQSQSKPTVDMESQREDDRAESTMQSRPLPLTPSEIPSNAVTQQDQTSPASRAPLAPDMSNPSISGATDNICAASDPQPDGSEVNEIGVAGTATPPIVNAMPASSQQQHQQPLNHREIQSCFCPPDSALPSAIQANAHQETRSPAAEGQPPPAVPNDPLDTLAVQERENRKTLLQAVEQADTILELYGIKSS